MMTMEKIKLDMHVHTNYSRCGNIHVDKLKKICQKKGIIPVITDHNTMKGSRKYRSIIPAEEISTQNGEIIGYFMNEEIPYGLSVEETIDRLRQQGALVCVPHPFDVIRKTPLEKRYLRQFIRKIDAIEIFNGRNLFSFSDRKAEEFADKNRKLKTVGSDAHIEFEIGQAYILMDRFDSRTEFIKNLKNAIDSRSYYGKRSNILNLISGKLMKISKTIRGDKNGPR